MADLTQSIPENLEILFSVNDDPVVLDVSDLDGSASAADLEAVLVALLDHLAAAHIVELDESGGE